MLEEENKNIISEDIDDFENEEIDINTGDDEEEEIDLIIEINDDDVDISIDEEEVVEEKKDEEVKPAEKEDVVLSKHKVEGKHALKYDSIFKGKKEEPLNEYTASDSNSTYNKDVIELDKTSSYHHESINNEDYIRGKEVKVKVYDILKEHTKLNFNNNRRKPSRVDFNEYYLLLKKHLKVENFTNIELFNELSFYFSDNLFNMFKLLDNKWRNLIITELEEHIGKNANSKDVSNRNISEGTELEFKWVDEFDEFGEVKIITGVVLEVDYLGDCYEVDSYENIYHVRLEDVVKILNNTKFKYNLNKLNHVDFL